MLDVIEQKYLKQLPHILGAITIFVVTTALAVSLFWIRASRPTTQPINSNAVLVVFEGGNCEDCVTFRRTIGRAYAGTPTGELIPIRYYDVSGGPPPKRYGIAGDLGDGPTAVVFDIYGRESARWAGLPTSIEKFENFVKPHLRKAQRDLEHAASNGYVN